MTELRILLTEKQKLNILLTDPEILLSYGDLNKVIDDYRVVHFHEIMHLRRVNIHGWD